jgi:hypothetical protein
MYAGRLGFVWGCWDINTKLYTDDAVTTGKSIVQYNGTSHLPWQNNHRGGNQLLELS